MFDASIGLISHLPSNHTHICTSVLYTSLSSSTYDVKVFNLIMAIIILLWVCFTLLILLLRERIPFSNLSDKYKVRTWLRHRILSTYVLFLLVSCAALLLTVGILLTSISIFSVDTLLRALALCFFWFVEVGFSYFLSLNNCSPHERNKSIRFASVIAVGLTIVWFTPVLLTNPDSVARWIGSLLSQAFLVIYFATLFIAKYIPFLKYKFCIRSSGERFVLFNLVVNTLFLVVVVLYEINLTSSYDTITAAHCISVISYSMFYVLFVPAVIITAVYDSATSVSRDNLPVWTSDVDARISAADDLIEDCLNDLKDEEEDQMIYYKTPIKMNDDYVTAALISALEQEGVPVIPFEELEFPKSNVMGEGLRGQVFCGNWKGTKVAFKKFKVDGTAALEEGRRRGVTGIHVDESCLRSIARETRMMAFLKHPNILQVLGIVYQRPTTIGLVLNLADRGSLFDLINEYVPSKEERPILGFEREWDTRRGLSRSQRLEEVKELSSWKVRLSWARDIAKGLAFLHSQSPPIIHRDLKSHNILIRTVSSRQSLSLSRALIADFGISRFERKDLTMTQVGTPQWMAPEVLRHERYGLQADIYSFSIILWELASLKPPFQGVSSAKVVHLISKKSARLRIPSKCPLVVAQLIQDCWSEHAGARPTAQLIIQRLEAIDVNTL